MLPEDRAIWENYVAYQKRMVGQSDELPARTLVVGQPNEVAAVSGRTFRCPDDMADDMRDVFAGAYDVPGLEFDSLPVVLDVGANIGAFAVWAMARWPGAKVTCYEPNPAARLFLERNVAGEATVVPSAVRASMFAGPGRLRIGRNNLGEASFYDLGEQRSDTIEVDCIGVSSLPDCDVLKVDTEGCEWEIFVHYTARHTLPKAIMFEYHRAVDMPQIDSMLRDLDYTLVHGRIACADRGTLSYRRGA